MTMTSEAPTYHLTDAEREHFRSLYATGEYTLTDIAREYGRTRETISNACVGMTRPRLRLSAGIRLVGPRPIGQPPLPVVRLSERQMVRGRLWWPDLATACQHCGGRLLVRPAGWDDGEVACLLCARAVATVRGDEW